MVKSNNRFRGIGHRPDSKVAFLWPLISSKRRDAGSSANTARLRLQGELNAIKMRLAFAVFDDRKAGFNEDQPRWPKGSGENSGRWSGGPGAEGAGHRIGVGSSIRRGHHPVTQEVIDSPEFDLSQPARRVFRRFVTGPLGNGRHLYTAEHRQYNEALKENLRTFLQRRGLSGGQMTAADAIDFGMEILRSDDPRITTTNKQALRMRIYYLIVRYYLRGRE